MSESIKKKWGVVLAGLALLVLLVFLWSDKPAQPIPSPTPQTTESVETKMPTPTIPTTERKQLSVSNDRAVPQDDNEELEEEHPEPEVEADEPANQNYILCEHIVSGESQYEFTGEIRLINKGTKPVYGWSVNWEYEDGSTIVEASDVALGGNNPYTGEYLSWNAEIPPGETVTFTFTGIKSGDSAPKRVDVKGNFCM